MYLKGESRICSSFGDMAIDILVRIAFTHSSYERREQEGTDQVYDLEKIHAPLALPSSAWQLLSFPETKYKEPLKGSSQVVRMWGEKIVFSCLQ